MPVASIIANFLNGWVEGVEYDPAEWPEVFITPAYLSVAAKKRTRVTIQVGGPQGG